MVLRVVIVSINSVGLNETGDYSWLTITIVNQELQLLTQELQLFTLTVATVSQKLQ